jgi:hypothetical protein
MALVKCPECKKEISDKAPACPYCGYTTTAPKTITKQVLVQQKAPTQYGCGTVILLFFVFAIIYNLFKEDEPTAAATPTPPPKLTAADKALQADRKAFIDKCLREGIFYKIEVPADLPHLWVPPRFLNSDFDTKKKLAAIVYSYYITENPKQNLLIIKDSKTGKRIGDYSSSGLDLN